MLFFRRGRSPLLLIDVTHSLSLFLSLSLLYALLRSFCLELYKYIQVFIQWIKSSKQLSQHTCYSCCIVLWIRENEMRATNYSFVVCASCNYQFYCFGLEIFFIDTVAFFFVFLYMFANGFKEDPVEVAQQFFLWWFLEYLFLFVYSCIVFQILLYSGTSLGRTLSKTDRSIKTDSCPWKLLFDVA